MPFLLAEILNYQCAVHLKGVGSLSIIITKQFLTKIQLCILCKFHGLLQNIDILQVAVLLQQNTIIELVIKIL